MLYIGKAHGRFAMLPVTKKISTHAGQPYPWFTRSTVICNHNHFCVLNDDFGALSIKFACPFPYTARVRLNGDEYAKRQLVEEGIALVAPDNGVLSRDNAGRLQQILLELTEA